MPKKTPTPATQATTPAASTETAATPVAPKTRKKRKYNKNGAKVVKETAPSIITGLTMAFPSNGGVPVACTVTEARDLADEFKALFGG